MKRAIIGGFISLIGSIWTLAVIISANNYPIDGWSTPPGKLLMQITESNSFVLVVVLMNGGFRDCFNGN